LEASDPLALPAPLRRRYVSPEQGRISRRCGEARIKLENSPSPKESTMSYFPGMQKGNLDSVKSDAHGKIKKETVSLQGVSVTRVIFDVGAKMV
jgi:hypothetical protein